MNTYESKDVDLIISKDTFVDLYDEQIIDNKNLSTTNQQKLNNLLGRISTVESYSNNFQERITTLEMNSSTITVQEIQKINSNISNLKNKQIEYGNAIDGIQTKLNNFDNRITVNKDNIQEIRNGLSSYMSKNDNDLNSIKNDLINNINEFNKFKLDQIAENLNTNSQINRLNNQVSIHQQSITTLRSGYDTISAQVNEIKTKVNTTTNIPDVQELKDKIASANQKIDTLSNNTKNELDSIKTKHKTDTDNIVGRLYTIGNDFSTYKGTVDDKLGNIYTKSEIDTLLKNINVKPNDVYTKSETNALVKTVDDKFNNVYNKTEISTMLNNFCGKLEADNRYVNKSGDTINGKIVFAEHNEKNKIHESIFPSHYYHQLYGAYEGQAINVYVHAYPQLEPPPHQTMYHIRVANGEEKFEQYTFTKDGLFANKYYGNDYRVNSQGQIVGVK